MTRLSRNRRLSSAYSLMDELLASATEPMPAASQNYQLTRIYQGLTALESATEPTVNDWHLVADGYNMMETLVLEMKVCVDACGLLQDASRAMYLAGQKHLAGGSLRLAGDGAKAVRAVVEDYAEVIAQVPHRLMIKCHRLTEKRVQRIKTGQPQPHDQKVVAL